MRALRLARIAAEAEGLRLRHSAQRTVVRAILGLIALGLLFGALVFCQIAAWYWLRVSWDRPAAALILAGAELVLAAILALLAARSSPGRIEIEAISKEVLKKRNSSFGSATPMENKVGRKCSSVGEEISRAIGCPSGAGADTGASATSGITGVATGDGP